MPSRMTAHHTTTGQRVHPYAGGLVAEVRAALIRQGTNLSRWCAAQQIPRSSAIHALAGASNSPAAKRLRRRLLKAAGLS
jgi:hypothetical protein